MWYICIYILSAISYLDVVMDMLGSEESSLAILEHYKNTSENIKVNAAIKNATTDKTDSLCEARYFWYQKLVFVGFIINW